MKVTGITYLNNGLEIESYRYDGSVAYNLYVGLDDYVYGGWILEDGGGTTTLDELEQTNTPECIALIDSVNALIADPSTPWRDPIEEDLEYVREKLECWGIDVGEL